MEMCEGIKRKLDRELQEREIDFLKWVYERHVEDKKFANPKSE